MFKMRVTIGHEIPGYTIPGKDDVLEHFTVVRWSACFLGIDSTHLVTKSIATKM
jgi:hypothetical protein